MWLIGIRPVSEVLELNILHFYHTKTIDQND
jgi:hypothetical protein